MKKVSESERLSNAIIDKMCSWCGGYADVIIPNEVKLCSECNKKRLENE